MKTLLFTCLVFIASVGFSQNSEEKPVKEFAEFEVYIHDFGDITEEKDAVYEFKFVNTSGKELILNPPKTSCGCTSPYYPKEPIAPGAEETIKVKYSTKHRIGKFNKDIRVYAQGYDLPIVLRIRGEVKSAQAVNTLPKKSSNSLFK